MESLSGYEISRLALRGSNLGPKARLVAMAVAYECMKDGQASIAVSLLARRISMSERSVSRALNEMAESGEWKIRRGVGQRVTLFIPNTELMKKQMAERDLADREYFRARAEGYADDFAAAASDAPQSPQEAPSWAVEHSDEQTPASALSSPLSPLQTPHSEEVQDTKSDSLPLDHEHATIVERVADWTAPNEVEKRAQQMMAREATTPKMAEALEHLASSAAEQGHADPAKFLRLQIAAKAKHQPNGLLAPWIRQFAGDRLPAGHDSLYAADMEGAVDAHYLYFGEPTKEGYEAEW